jgi:hypothetical protein
MTGSAAWSLPIASSSTLAENRVLGDHGAAARQLKSRRTPVQPGQQVGERDLERVITGRPSRAFQHAEQPR